MDKQSSPHKIIFSPLELNQDGDESSGPITSNSGTMTIPNDPSIPNSQGTGQGKQFSMLEVDIIGRLYEERGVIKEKVSNLELKNEKLENRIKELEENTVLVTWPIKILKALKSLL